MPAAFEATRAVAAQQAAGGVEMRVVAHAGEDIEHRAFRGPGVEHAVGRQERQVQLARQAGGGGQQAILPAPQMPLHLDEHAPCAEHTAQLAQEGTRPGEIIPHQGPVERAVFIACQADEALGELGQFLPLDAAGGFGAAEFGTRDQPAEVLVAGARLDQQRQHGAVVKGQFRADDRPNAMFACRREKPRRAVNAVPVEQGERGHFEFRPPPRELRQRRRTAQKAKRAPAMKFDVVHKKVGIGLRPGPK